MAVEDEEDEKREVGKATAAKLVEEQEEDRLA